MSKNSDFLNLVEERFDEKSDDWLSRFQWTFKHGVYVLILINEDGETSVDTVVVTPEQLTKWIDESTKFGEENFKVDYDSVLDMFEEFNS